MAPSQGVSNNGVDCSKWVPRESPMTFRSLRSQTCLVVVVVVAVLRACLTLTRTHSRVRRDCQQWLRLTLGRGPVACRLATTASVLSRATMPKCTRGRTDRRARTDRKSDRHTTTQQKKKLSGVPSQTSGVNNGGVPKGEDVGDGVDYAKCPCCFMDRQVRLSSRLHGT